MAKLAIKLVKKDLAALLRKGERLEKELTNPKGTVYKFLLTIANGYKEAVISGMGQTDTGILTLKSFLDTPVSVNWKPLSPSTLKLKAKAGWSLKIWKATGETENAVCVIDMPFGPFVDIFAGIDGTLFPEAYAKALRTEFGMDIAAMSDPGEKPLAKRALFTLLNAVLAEKADKVYEGVNKAIAEAIAKVWR
jgi:hypothetical protein